MKASVEDIIRTKAYFQLTPDELVLVKEYAATAEEYDEMRWFLQNVNDAFQSQKIDASPGLKTRVMEHLEKSDKKVGVAPGGVRRFFFPQGASIIQMPGFQLAAAAAVVIGVFIVIGNPLEDQASDLAVNDKITSEQDPSLVGGDETGELVATDTIAAIGNGEVTGEEAPAEQPLGAGEKNVQDHAREIVTEENEISSLDELSESDGEEDLRSGNQGIVNGGTVGNVDNVSNSNTKNSPLRQENVNEKVDLSDDKKNQEGYSDGTTVTGTFGGVAKESSKTDEDDRLIFSSARQKQNDEDKSLINQPVQDIALDDKEKDKVAEETVVLTVNEESMDAKGEKGKDANLKSRTETLESPGSTGPADFVAPVNLSIGLSKELKTVFYTVK